MNCAETIRCREAEGGKATAKRHCLVRGILALILAGMPGLLWGQRAAEITTVGAVRSLNSDEAGHERPVRLRGVVTVLSGWKNSFFFQDKTSGISVDRIGDDTKLESGDLVEIRGTTGPGKFAPVVLAARVTVLGRAQMPPTRVLGYEQLARGKEDSQWLAVRGVVRSATVKQSWGRQVLIMRVDIGDGHQVAVRVHDFPESGAERLLDSTIFVRGVCGTIFNNLRQFVGFRVFVSNLTEVKVEKPPPADPFAIPLRPLGNLLQFGDKGGFSAPVKITGVVTFSGPKHELYIQDGTQGVLVRARQEEPLALGSRVEAVGYAAEGRYSAVLEDASVRVVGSSRPLPGLVQAASGMIAVTDGFPGAPFDSVLVRLQGRLVEEFPGTEEKVLLLKDGGIAFSVRLPQAGSADRIRPELRIGSLLSVTGICVAKPDNAREAHSFEILLRSPADVVVVEAGTWWTASRLQIALELLVLVSSLMLGAMVLLRRQAGLRTLALTDELTGLYNRRGFFLIAEHQWRLALRKGATTLFFYIDLNKFKEINDTLGHKEGDAALKEVAGALRACFRKTDLIGRLGGDEFAVMAIEANPRSREELRRRLFDLVEDSNRRAGRNFRLSLSVGVLTCDSAHADSSIEDLLAEADGLMYDEKRGSMCVYGEQERVLAMQRPGNRAACLVVR